MRLAIALAVLAITGTEVFADDVVNHVRFKRPLGIDHAAAPGGLSPRDLQIAYHIDPDAGGSPTVALVEAFGYTALEADLAVYRAQFHLPPCTTQNGCLRIVNGSGQTSPLPADDPQDTGNWKTEMALDVDAVSAACPRCKILVLEAATANLADLTQPQQVAVQLGAAVVSNSWGVAFPKSNGDLSQYESAFDHAGVPTFVSSGDNGYNEAGMGPQYPSLSIHAIAVGGTHLDRATTSVRGWTESAWTSAGSSCSDQIAKQAYETTSSTACAFHASASVSALADPDTGNSVYTKQYGWILGGGTSLAAPLVAAMVAGAGLATTVSSAWFAQHANKLNDITAGSTGTCALCTTAVGWDGPTGFGSLDIAALTNRPYTPPSGDGTGGALLSITSPPDAAIVRPGFQVTVDYANAVSADLFLDGAHVDTRTSAPFSFTTPASIGEGMHTVRVVGTAANGDASENTIRVVVDNNAAPLAGQGAQDVIGGCATGGGTTSIFMALALVGLIRKRGSRS